MPIVYVYISLVATLFISYDIILLLENSMKINMDRTYWNGSLVAICWKGGLVVWVHNIINKLHNVR